MQALGVRGFFRLDRNGRGHQPERCLANRPGVICIVFVGSNKRLHVLLRNQKDRMSQRLDLSPPIMRRATRIYRHLTGRKVRESLFELGAAELFLRDFMSLFDQSGQNKNGFAMSIKSMLIFIIVYPFSSDWCWLDPTNTGLTRGPLERGREHFIMLIRMASF